MLKTLKDLDVRGKKVFLRVDFNVELDDLAHVQEQYKLEVMKRTLAHLLDQGAARVALVSHYGRPDGAPDPKYSLGRLLPEVIRVLERPITFVPACTGSVVAEALQAAPMGGVLLLENVRFFAGEENNDPNFSRELAAPFDIYVNEAFSASHRAHASIVGVPSLLPSAAGLHMVEEITKLEVIRTAPDRPAVAVIGGAKIETKLPLIRAMESLYDCVLVGGKIANEAIDQGLTFSEKVLLPQDFDSDKRLDIGPRTAASFAAIIKKAKTLVWNGPLGKFEEKPYDFGTNVILQAILESEATVVIGGGESLAVLEEAGVFHKIGYVSTGGGAMLEYMSGKVLPGLSVLMQK